MASLSFLGANGQVTGSRYCLHANNASVMVDCGLFQERPYLARNWDRCPVPPDQLKALLLTHAHIDHTGLVPKLVREGFHGPIWCTRPTVDLCEVMLRDSAKIQSEDAAYKKKRHGRERRHGPHPEVPLYVDLDAERALKQFRGVDYNQPVEIAEGITAVWHDAGHILGSAMIEVTITERGQKRRVLFSGDLGRPDKPLLHDPQPGPAADHLILESTYGDREHPSKVDVEELLTLIVKRTVERGGKVIVPVFAVERAQEMLYYLNQLRLADKIPEIPVFLDSPMAVDVTGIFRRYASWLDDEARTLINSGDSPFHFPNLHLSRSVQESKLVNEYNGPAIIMAPAGMCNAGRIKHHLRAHLSKPTATILFVGYQAEGTLGRQIVDGQERVRIHGQEYEVNATIEKIEGFSAHAGRRELLDWLRRLPQPPAHIYLTHGEKSAAEALRAAIRDELGWTSVTIPEYDSVVRL